MQPLVQPQMQRPAALGPDRSIVTAAGGIVAIGGPTQVEKLPAETGGPFLILFNFHPFWTFFLSLVPSSLSSLWFTNELCGFF